MKRICLVGSLMFASVAVVSCSKDPSAGKPAASTGEASGAAQKAHTLKGSEYVFSNDGSRLTFVASKVTQSHDGSFESFRGSVDLVEGDPEKSSVQVEIDMPSVTTDTAKLTNHLKSPDLLDVAKYPKASFVSTRVQKQPQGTATHLVSGDFELHGVTKGLSFPAKLDVQDGGLVGSAEFSINRQEFGITYPGMPDDLIKDSVLIKLDIHAKPR